MALAIGVFDGIHRGHEAVLEAALASPLPVKAVMTFTPDFKSKVTNSARPYLMTLNEKVAEIGKLGDFSSAYVMEPKPELVSLPPKEFIERILRPLGVREVYVGEDFTFGRFGVGRPQDLSQAGITTYVIPLVKIGGEKIGTTQLIAALNEGNLDKANEMLGRPYSFTGIVEKGFQEGRKLGFPTLNLYPLEGQETIARGVYATLTIIGGATYASMTNVGTHPTINELKAPAIETNVLDFKRDVYGQKATIVFLKKIREEMRFPSVDEMVERMMGDEKVARSICQPYLEAKQKRA